MCIAELVSDNKESLGITELIFFIGVIKLVVLP